MVHFHKKTYEGIPIAGLPVSCKTYIEQVRIFRETVGGALIIIGNGIEFKSWTRLIAFHSTLIPLRKAQIHLFSHQQSRLDFSLGKATSL